MPEAVKSESFRATTDLVTRARKALGAVKHTIAEAERQVPDCPGLYAIYSAQVIWQQLGLGDPPDERPPDETPLYVGKAEESLRCRDLKQHFGTGTTGASTVRRTFAALLRGKYGFRGVPRNKSKPGKWSHYALDDQHEVVLTEWMRENLKLSVWAKPIECGDLRTVEKGVLAKVVPPLNLQDNPMSTWRAAVRKARKAMAEDAKAWAVAHDAKVVSRIR